MSTKQTAATTEQAERGRRKERRGIVVADTMDKTVVVRVDILKPHPKYKKMMRRSDAAALSRRAEPGEAGRHRPRVETRPLSKTKRWRVAEIVEVAK